MATAELASETDFDGWRRAAREMRLAGVEPAAARFVVAGAFVQSGLFDRPPAAHPRFRGDKRGDREFSVPKAFGDLAQDVILHRSADRFDLLYRLLWRLRDEPDLIRVISSIGRRTR